MMEMGGFYAMRANEPLHRRWGKKLLRSLDLSENLQKWLRAVKTVPNGIISFILFLPAALVSLCLVGGALYFDIFSTWTNLEPFRQAVMSVTEKMTVLKTAAFFAFLVSLLPMSITLAPTAMEMLGSRFARFDIPAFQVLTWFFILFDLITDLPTVNAFLAPYWAQCVTEPYANASFLGLLFSFSLRVWGGAIGWYVAWILLTAAASYFLEMAAVLMVGAAFMFLVKSVLYWVLGWLVGYDWFRHFINNFAGMAQRGRGFTEDVDDIDIDPEDLDDWVMPGRNVRGPARRMSRQPMGRGRMAEGPFDDEGDFEDADFVFDDEEDEPPRRRRAWRGAPQRQGARRIRFE